MSARELIEHALGEPIARMSPLTGGCVAEVYRVHTAGGLDLAVKVETGPEPGLDLEAGMLGALAEHAPTPDIVVSDPRVLALRYIAHAGGPTPAGERRLAEIVGNLHGVTGPAYGFAADTRIGPIRLPNAWHTDWGRWYVEGRLRPVVALAERRGALPRAFAGRFEVFAERIGRILGGPGGEGPGVPSLIHGDLWAGNVLWRDGLPVALIDPSAQWADPEFELAFIDLMGGVSGAFWERYGQLRPIRAGFWERRVHAYQVFPLVVHAALFGGGYGQQALNSLERALA